MSVMDKFLNAMKLNDEDDDDFYDDDYYDEPEPVKKSAPAREDNLDEDKSAKKVIPKVTPMRQTKKIDNILKN